MYTIWICFKHIFWSVHLLSENNFYFRKIHNANWQEMKRKEEKILQYRHMLSETADRCNYCDGSRKIQKSKCSKKCAANLLRSKKYCCIHSERVYSNVFQTHFRHNHHNLFKILSLIHSECPVILKCVALDCWTNAHIVFHSWGYCCCSLSLSLFHLEFIFSRLLYTACE